jgi:hypothetical protein
MNILPLLLLEAIIDGFFLLALLLKINFVILIVYLALIIGIEQAFRQPMFTDSLEFQRNWQINNPNINIGNK